MGFLKLLIGLPILVVILIFAFVNNDLATFSLWPFYIEITVSLSVAIVFLLTLGFVLGSFFSWLSYAPVRSALRKQKRKNKQLSKEHLKLSKEVEDLHTNIATLKDTDIVEPKKTLGQRIKGFFSKKPVSENSKI